jgi:hypothetical protein
LRPGKGKESVLRRFFCPHHLLLSYIYNQSRMGFGPPCRELRSQEARVLPVRQLVDEREQMRGQKPKERCGDKTDSGKHRKTSHRFSGALPFLRGS